jgi:hypothetical protein
MEFILDGWMKGENNPFDQYIQSHDLYFRATFIFQWHLDHLRSPSPSLRSRGNLHYWAI